MKIRYFLLFFGIFYLLSGNFVIVWADVPRMINYQGHVSVEGSAFDGMGQFKFAIVDADATETYWSNDGTSTIGGEPTNAVQLYVSKGVYSVSLGDIALANMNEIASSVFQNNDVHLRVWFNDGSHGFQLLEPDQRITAVAYAMVADTVTSSGVTGSMIADNTIDESKLSFTPLNLDTSSIYENPGGNIGIGTTNPYAKLDVNGQIRVRNGYGLFFAENGYIGSHDDHHRILFRRSENKLELREHGDIIFSPGSTDGLETAEVVINPGGYMGVGVANTYAAKVHVRESATFGTAVLGEATATDEYGSWGGRFIANSGEGIGVYGEASKGGNFVNYGGYFVAKGAQGRAVYGEAGDSSLTNYGGYFVSDSLHGRGIYAEATGAYGIAAVFKGKTQTGVLEITGGSDLSEQFNIRGTKNGIVPEPGMVVTIDSDNPGALAVSDEPYDKRVAGIISGAGGINPGMLMGQKGSKADGNNPVALTGRVYCLADASMSKIKPGDLLTTSNTPGHAMKATDYTKANGSILGKAMTNLDKGRGLVLVLVTLQ